MRLIICDRCGKGIKSTYDIFRLTLSQDSYADITDELCESCKNKVYDTLNLIGKPARQ